MQKFMQKIICFIAFRLYYNIIVVTIEYFQLVFVAPLLVLRYLIKTFNQENVN